MQSAEPNVKRITFRLRPELYAQAQEYLDYRRAKEPKYSLNDLCLEAVGVITSPTSPLARFRMILDVGKRELRAALSESELNLIMDSCNGLAMWYHMGEMGDRPFIITAPGQMIAHNVYDSIALNGLDEKWSVDKSLPDKVAALSIPAQYALADLVERFWDNPEARSAIEML